MSGPSLLQSRRLWAGLCTAIPSVLLSLRYFDVYSDPWTGANREWTADAPLLIKLELLLIFVTALTAWIAAHLSVVRRIAAMSALAAVLGAAVYALWVGSDGSAVVLGVALLIVGRFLTALITGPEAVTELLERAAVGAVFYFAILFLVYALPEMLPPDYAYRPRDPAAAFCALYYLLHALVEGAQIYLRSADPAARGLTVDIDSSEWLLRVRLQLRFLGDAVEIVRTGRARPAGRILAFFFGLIFVGLGLAGIIATRATLFFPAVIPLLMGGAIAFKALRGSPGSAWIAQVRPGELATVALEDGKFERVKQVPAAEIERIYLEQDAESRVPDFHLGARLRNGDPALIMANVGSEARAATLQRLVELYLKGDARPEKLRQALHDDPELAAMLGLKAIRQLLAAAPMPLRTGTMACPGCANEIVAGTPRCAYCGLLHPALGA